MPANFAKFASMNQYCFCSLSLKMFCPAAEPERGAHSPPAAAGGIRRPRVRAYPVRTIQYIQ